MSETKFRKINNLLGWFVFSVALITYGLTVEPTASYWDAGEYIATSAKLQVGHPPGAPLYQMLGAVFSLFATSPEKIALAVNWFKLEIALAKGKKNYDKKQTKKAADIQRDQERTLKKYK